LSSFASRSDSTGGDLSPINQGGPQQQVPVNAVPCPGEATQRMQCATLCAGWYFVTGSVHRFSSSFSAVGTFIRELLLLPENLIFLNILCRLDSFFQTIGSSKRPSVSRCMPEGLEGDPLIEMSLSFIDKMLYFVKRQSQVIKSCSILRLRFPISLIVQVGDQIKHDVT
jgi:hypothetical protein